VAEAHRPFHWSSLARQVGDLSGRDRQGTVHNKATGAFLELHRCAGVVAERVYRSHKARRMRHRNLHFAHHATWPPVGLCRRAKTINGSWLRACGVREESAQDKAKPPLAHVIPLAWGGNSGRIGRRAECNKANVEPESSPCKGIP